MCAADEIIAIRLRPNRTRISLRKARGVVCTMVTRAWGLVPIKPVRDTQIGSERRLCHSGRMRVQFVLALMYIANECGCWENYYNSSNSGPVLALLFFIGLCSLSMIHMYERTWWTSLQWRHMGLMGYQINSHVAYCSRVCSHPRYWPICDGNPLGPLLLTWFNFNLSMDK